MTTPPPKNPLFFRPMHCNYHSHSPPKKQDPRRVLPGTWTDSPPSSPSSPSNRNNTWNPPTTAEDSNNFPTTSKSSASAASSRAMGLLIPPEEEKEWLASTPESPGWNLDSDDLGSRDDGGWEGEQPVAEKQTAAGTGEGVGWTVVDDKTAEVVVKRSKDRTVEVEVEKEKGGGKVVKVGVRVDVNFYFGDDEGKIRVREGGQYGRKDGDGGGGKPGKKDQENW